MKNIANILVVVMLLLSSPSLLAESPNFRYETYEKTGTRRYRKNTKKRPKLFRSKSNRRAVKPSRKKTVRKKSAKSRKSRKRTRRTSRGKAKKRPSTYSGKAVNLDDLDRKPARYAQYGPPSGVKKQLKLFFDLVLSYRPETNSAFKFDNYHTVFLIEYAPKPNIQFSMGFAPPDASPKFYQIQYDWTERFQIRAGRIWIPFDSINPHNTFGGIYNTSQLRASNQDAFLPDIWTDLGVAAKINLLRGKTVTLDQHFYLVNGFHDGGTDPLGESSTYPEFGGVSSDQEANTDKAMGTRSELSIGNSFNLGASLYTGRYSDGDEESARILMLGLDSRIRFGRQWQLKGGYLFTKVDLPLGTSRKSFLRGGVYGDLSYRFARQWEIVAKGGILQNDDGVLDQNDRTLVGLRLNFRPSPVVYLSLEHHRDIQDTANKLNKHYTALRISILL